MLETMLGGELPVVESFAEECSIRVGGAFHVAFLLDVGLGEDTFFGLVGHHSVEVSVTRKSTERREDDRRLTPRADKDRLKHSAHFVVLPRCSRSPW